ncbi:MAG: hypothetical protein MUO67_01350 [Anaerolineales bacterium]|nr:hypothetical protein [Anaerolineales bacterium]
MSQKLPLAISSHRLADFRYEPLSGDLRGWQFGRNSLSIRQLHKRRIIKLAHVAGAVDNGRLCGGGDGNGCLLRITCDALIHILGRRRPSGDGSTKCVHVETPR